MKRKLFTLLFLLAPVASQAVVIIDGSTYGRYNAGLGDLAR